MAWCVMWMLLNATTDYTNVIDTSTCDVLSRLIIFCRFLRVVLLQSKIVQSQKAMATVWLIW